MGMFDELRCEYPLPGIQPEDPAVLQRMQTKDFECSLGVFTVDADKWLRDSKGEIYRWLGNVYFYGSNFAASSGATTYTSDGQDCEWTAYKARISFGRLTSVEQVEYARKPAKPMKDLGWN